MNRHSDPYDEYFEGSWRIVDAGMWDTDSLDLMGPAHISFGTNRLGNMKFVAVDINLDFRSGIFGGVPIVEFTFFGNDDNNPTYGRGWARLESDNQLRGNIFFHCGDESTFTAERE